MKKIILNFIGLIGISLLMTGCLTAPYKYEYISGQLKPDLKKVNKNICINELSEKNVITVEKYGIDFYVKEINKNVSQKYFEQYFIDVNQKNKECFLTINTKIEKINTKFISLDGMNAEFRLDVKIYEKENELVKINTDEEYSSEVLIMIPLAVFLGGSAPYKTANEVFHKGLLDVYETKIEELLLKALKKNQ